MSLSPLRWPVWTILPFLAFSLCHPDSFFSDDSPVDYLGLLDQEGRRSRFSEVVEDRSKLKTGWKYWEKIFRTSWILTWRLSCMEILRLKLTDWLKMSRKVNVFSENYQGWSITCVHILPWFHFQGLARKREIAKTLSPTPTPSSMSGCFGSKWLTQYFSSSVFGHKHLSTMLTKIVSQHSVHKCLIIDRPRAGVSQ